MKNLLSILFLFLPAACIFSHPDSTATVPCELHILDTFPPRGHPLDAIYRKKWFENYEGLYSEEVDMRDVIYNSSTGEPFTGRICTYREPDVLNTEQNFLNGRKHGWQTLYNKDGAFYETRRYAPRNPSTSPEIPEKDVICWEKYEYYSSTPGLNHRLKRSLILLDESTGIYREKRYYNTGELLSEGNYHYVTVTRRYQISSILGRTPSKRAKRKSRRNARRGIGFIEETGTEFQKTGYWKFYEADGTIREEGIIKWDIPGYKYTLE